MTLVADTSALVSLGCADPESPVVVDRFFEGYDVVIPRIVVDELTETADYADRHARAARVILDRGTYAVHDTPTDADVPLDAGETAVVALANDLDADFCYCDEFARLAVVHASLVTARLVTTPRLLEAFVLHGDLERTEARAVLDRISEARSWATNAYVQQTRSWFDNTEE